MATALQQAKSNNVSSASTVVVTITSSLAGSVLWAFTASGTNGATLNLPTDSGLQTWVNLAPQVNQGSAINARMDDMRNTASGITTVTGHSGAASELSCTVNELTGTNNALDGSVPALTAGSGSTSLATGSITTATGSILAAGATDNGGTNAADTVSPAAYVMDGLTPNGTNERVASASAANVASGGHTATFTVVGTIVIAGQAAYAVAAAGGGIPPGLGPAEHMQPAMTMPIGW